jgi:hypothetical protein
MSRGRVEERRADLLCDLRTLSNDIKKRLNNSIDVRITLLWQSNRIDPAIRLCFIIVGGGILFHLDELKRRVS